MQEQENKDQYPHISIESQYIKDLSFENPSAPGSMISRSSIPTVEIGLDVEVVRLEESRDVFEVTLKIEATAKNNGNNDSVLFMIELAYAGVFVLENIPNDQKEPALAIHCPNMIFPFARRIISDITSDSGIQPLRIDPIDFGVLYHKKMLERSSEGEA